jgi:hypothetical protein
MGAPGLAFETWDPSNQFPLETTTLLFVIPRVGDFFALSAFLHIPRQIRHPERSASQIYRKQRAYSAESKDPGNAYWQML